jgi:general secretion pathway protein L
MSDTLLIHFNPARSDDSSWALVNDAGEVTSKLTRGELSQASELAKQHRVVVLLDNTLVHINSVSLPTQNQQKLLRAIPFALEEDIADDIEDMHFVAAKTVKDEATAVAGIHRNVLDNILATLTQAGIQADAIIPDCLCLAASSSQWCALFHDEQVNLQTDTLLGNEFDAGLFDTILTAALNDESKTRPAKLLLFTKEGEQIPEVNALQAADENIEVINVQYNTHPIVVYAGHYRQALALNLLQHDYKPQKAGTISWRRWRMAASLALIWLVLSLGISGYKLQQLKQQNNALQAEIIKIYKSAFPKSKRIVNARVQMEQKLKQLNAGGAGASNSMVGLIARSAQALSSNQAVTLRTISFRNNRLDLAVNSKDLNALQKLNTDLNAIAGIKSEIISSSSEQNQVKASLRIQRAAT